MKRRPARPLTEQDVLRLGALVEREMAAATPGAPIAPHLARIRTLASEEGLVADTPAAAPHVDLFGRARGPLQ